ncbi:MAG TPA: hypothetical protein VGD98_22800 [Ktedonobacteraceae bacterium]
MHKMDGEAPVLERVKKLRKQLEIAAPLCLTDPPYAPCSSACGKMAAAPWQQFSVVELDQRLWIAWGESGTRA